MRHNFRYREENMERSISILGATGSVGQQALDVARTRGYKIDFLSANRDVRAMEKAAREFRPRAVAMADSYAQNGDIVILSPASTSFDRFKNFEERGRVFKDLVRKLPE